MSYKLLQNMLCRSQQCSFITTQITKGKLKTNGVVIESITNSRRNSTLAIKSKRGEKEIAIGESKDPHLGNIQISQYRTFLKAGVEAVTPRNRPHIKSLIRQGFENKEYLSDPELELKAKNTLELLRLSSERNGIEHALVNNMCQLKYFKNKDDRRPPFYNRSFPAKIKEMHATSMQDLQSTIDMLNKDLKLLL